MTLDPAMLWRLLLDTVRSPAEVARIILRLGLERDALWMALGLVTVISVLVAAVLGLMLPVPEDAARDTIPLTPFLYAVILGGALIVMVFALHFTGLMLGGEGQFEDTLALVVWLQVVLIALQVVQSVSFVVLPALAALITVGSVALAIWVLVNFINEAQRFGSLGRAFATTLVAL